MMNENTLSRPMGALFLLPLLLITPAVAGLNEIPLGGTMFVGEEGLDITATGVPSGGEIGWWAPGTSVQDATPSYTLRVDDNTSFYVDPITFASRTGPWYSLPDRRLAFYVQLPAIELKVFDVRTGRDRTQGKVIRGDELMFRIASNLYSMTERGVQGAPVTIRVRDPNGVEFDSLVNASGERTSLVEIPVDSQLFFTVPIWDTGYSDYQFGTYEIWAECNANKMKDNYPVEGRTITSKEERPVEEIGITVTITTTGTPTATVTPTTVFTVSPPATMTLEVTTSVAPTTAETPVTTPAATTTMPGYLAATAILALLIVVLRRWP
ncbi:MAG: DUF3821 domain-containing protein [Methanomicrobiales archaeon]|nr:DUF3821 domain-containing protein [Methanomicrobiales archaeon]